MRVDRCLSFLQVRVRWRAAAVLKSFSATPPSIRSTFPSQDCVVKAVQLRPSHAVVAPLQFSARLRTLDCWQFGSALRPWVVCFGYDVG
jgi:hypothetical protein